VSVASVSGSNLDRIRGELLLRNIWPFAVAISSIVTIARSSGLLVRRALLDQAAEQNATDLALPFGGRLHFGPQLSPGRGLGGPAACHHIARKPVNTSHAVSGRDLATAAGVVRHLVKISGRHRLTQPQQR
jgi:hypothetical protein